jgi:hypothetical protein
VKHGAKNSQMLMGTENTVYKGKSLHVRRNNKNNISKNQNGKHNHCFMIHLNKFYLFLNIKSTEIHGLTPKGQSSFFSKKHLKGAISSSRSPNKKIYYFFPFLTVRSCPRLLGKYVQKVSQKLTARIGKEKFFFLVPGRERSCPFFAKKQVSCHNV